MADLYLILPCQLQRGFNRFRSAAGEVNGAAAEVFSGESQQFGGVFFGDWRRELAAVDEFDSARLLGHGLDNFGHSMTDKIHRGRSGKIQILLATRVPQARAFAPHGGWEHSAKRTAQQGRILGLPGSNLIGHG